MTSRALSVAECRLLLGTQRIGRVVFTDRALPCALPVNYLVTAGGVVFRTDPGRPLASTLTDVDDVVLGFEVDEVDEQAQSGWSVLVVGLGRRVVDAAEIRSHDEAGLRSWGADDGSVHVRISMDRLSGRAVGPPFLESADGHGPLARSRPVA